MKFVNQYLEEVSVIDEHKNNDVEQMKCNIYEYQYDKKNRIEHPEKYQYSIYGGIGFLNKFEKSREEAINNIENSIENIEQFDNCIREEVRDNRKRFLLDHIKKSNEVNISSKTTADLLLIWEKVIESKSKDDLDEDIVKVIFVYLKKYEVTKKIYNEYDLNFKPKSNYYRGKLNYLLLSNLLCDYYQLLNVEHEKLIVLNTILKLNDLIASIIKDCTTPAEKLLAFSSLFKEKNIYFTLLKELQ